MKKLSLKQCTAKDLELLQEISISTYFQTFERFNPPEIMSAYLQDAFNTARLKGELDNPDSAFYFLYFGENIAGYLKINEAPSQTDLNDKDSLEIERFYISSDFQGNGLGQFLMNFAIDVALKRKKEYVWLGVWEHNEKAKRFYNKNGFYQIGSHSFFMGDDDQTDFILRKDL